MATEKKERKMSVKGFLTKANSKSATASVAGFLAAYREYLLTGEVSYATAPIIASFDDGKLLPTPCLEQIKIVVLDHILAVDKAKAEESLKRESHPSSDKPFTVTIKDSITGKVCYRIKDDGTTEQLIKHFDLPQDAERWADRRLFDGEPTWYAEVVKKNDTRPYWDIIQREDSIARTLKRPKTALSKTVSYGSSLGFGMKIREKAVKFSHG